MSKIKVSKMSKLIPNRFFGQMLISILFGFSIMVSCKDDDPEPENQIPVAAFASSLTSANVGEEITFTDASSDEDGEIVSWLWDFGNGTTSTDQNPTISYEEEGSYTVTLTVTDDEGDTNSASETISIEEGVIEVSFSTSVEESTIEGTEFLFGQVYTDSIYFAGMEIQFTDASGVGNAATTNFSWDFGDGSTSYEQNPTHTFTESGASYMVSLTVTDENNATGTFSKTIHVPGIKWKVTGEDYETMSPAIDNSGNIYVGTGSGLIQKFDSNGNTLWTLDIGGGESVRASIALSDDEQTIYVGSNAANFHAIDASSGQSIWSYNTNGGVDKSGAAIDPDGNVYVGTDAGILYAFSADGDSLWTFNGHDGDINGNALYHDSKVIVADDSVVYAVNAADGELAWYYVMSFPGNTTRARFEGGFALDQSGTLYGTYQDYGQGELFALNIADGTEVWSTELPADARANSPLLSPDESIVYLATEDGLDQNSTSFCAYNTSDGSKVWITQPAGDDFKVTGALGSTGALYNSSYDDYYYLIDSETGNPMLKMQLTDPDTDYPSAVPGIGEDGTIYWGSRAQTFFALYFFGELESLPETGWPVRGGDNKNRNRMR